MLDYYNINKGEDGLSIRGKLNLMFSSLLRGTESVNQVWASIQKIISEHDDLKESTESQYRELKEQVLDSFDHTDWTASDLLLYINAINGGVSGFADTTTYNPQIPEDKAATVIAVGSGTYMHFLDADGNPTVIDSPQSFTVFYKGVGSTYWKHKTINLEVVVDENVDGGSALTKYGGSKVVDGGNAEGR